MKRFVFLLAFTGCGLVIDSDRAVMALEKQGWTDVQVFQSHRLSPRLVGGCGTGDDAAFEMTGKNPAGKQSDATVCCGAWPKGCTVRF